MSFTGNENHSISLKDASLLTANFRTSHPSSMTIKGFYFGKTAIQDILNQTDCVGIRIYFGEDNSNNPKLVLVGVRANEDDIENGHLAEYGLPCPPHNSAANSLNS